MRASVRSSLPSAAQVTPLLLLLLLCCVHERAPQPSGESAHALALAMQGRGSTACWLMEQPHLFCPSRMGKAASNARCLSRQFANLNLRAFS